MRFYKGIRFSPHRPRRGAGRGTYRMSHMAHRARISNAACARAALAGWQGRSERTYGETRRLELEIALGRHRGETYRALAKRLGLRSHAHCWRVARRYRLGLLPLLPRGEQELITFRDSLYGGPPQRAVPWWMAHEWRSRGEIWGSLLLTQEQKVQAAAEFDRREYKRQRAREWNE